jgi:hypothetical protein
MEIRKISIFLSNVEIRKKDMKIKGSLRDERRKWGGERGNKRG